MGHPTPLDARALLSRLILHANEGVPWVDFFSNISQTLLDSTGCDAIEVLLQESTHAYRFLLSRKDGFHFERQQHRADARAAQADSAIDAVRRNISPACFDPTDRGSFFAADVQSRPGSRSLAMIPLVVGLDRLGVVQLHSESPGFFDHENIATFEAMADSLAVALMYHRAQWGSRERVKELSCLSALAQLADEPDLALDDILCRIAELLPSGWQYPAVCSAVIRLDGAEYASSGRAPWVDQMQADLFVGSERHGEIVVGYAEKRPEFDEGPFLREERHLIDEASRQIGLIVNRRQTDDERNRLQDQLRHSDRLATIGQLAAGVAHELNEPLGAVIGFAQLAKKAPRLPRQASQDIDRIVKAALHAREVVKKLMIFGRQTPPQKSLVSINRLVEDGLDFVRARCDSEGIELDLQLAEDLPPIVADPSQLHQVLVNLVVNAVQATTPPGRILISTSVSPGFVHLAVEDQGAGMSAEVIQQIFLPFFTTKQVGHGTGLGLAVVHGIVTSHGGSIHVDSALGKGTRFDVRLPVSAQEQAT